MFPKGASAQEIDFPLTVSNDLGAEITLRFGLDPSATDGIDPKLGEMELPPAPPADVFEARFSGSNIQIPDLGLGTYRDYREGSVDFEGEIVHELRFQAGGGASVTIAWDLPDDVSGRLQDFISGTIIDVTMTGEGSFVVTNPAGFSSLKMTMTYEEEPNQPPVFDSTPVTEAEEGEIYAYEIAASDPDGDAVSITAPQLPNWLILSDGGDGSALLTGTPTAADVGDHPVTLVASDGELTADQSFTISVAPMISNEPDAGIKRLAISEIFPNPVLVNATVVLEKPASGPLSIMVYDLVGREALSFIEPSLPEGRHSVRLPSASLGAGHYIVRIESDGETDTKRVTVLR